MPRGKKTGLGEAPVIVMPEKSKEEKLLDEIVWITKGKGGWAKSGSLRKDIYISAYKHAATKTKPPYNSLNISFRDGIEKTITKTGFISFGACKNRIYFKESNRSTGYKISYSSGTICCISTHLQDEVYEVFSKFGKNEYHLKFDDFQKLYNVELEANDD
jgi:hypothetical protein